MRPKNLAWVGNHTARGSTVSLKVPLRKPPLLASRRSSSLLFMKKKLLPFLAALLSLIPVIGVANDIEPSKEFYTVARAPNPIVLDGDLSEWTGVPVLADPKFYVRNGCEGVPSCSKFSGGTNATLVLFEICDICIPGTADWTGPDDHTSAVQMVYDADNVYLGFVVTDEYHENAANSAWNGDSVQLMIANSNRTQRVALYNYALGGIETALGNIIVEHEEGPGGTEAVITRNTNTHRTTYEIRLPKASLGLTSLAGGPQFGLGMAINDGDQNAPGQGGWGGLGAHSIVFGKHPTETALMTLTKGNDIEPGKEFYTATPITNTIVLDGNLSEWTGAPVLADPKFYVRNGCEGVPACSKFSAGVDAQLVLFEICDICIPGLADWTGPDDQTSAVQIVYDADNVYFGFVVTDEYHENAANSAWNGDSVQLMIANATRTTEVALYNYALGGVEDNLGTTIVEHERPIPPPGVTEAVVTRNTTTHRTIYEIKLPKSAVGLTNLTPGAQFGLGMAINDGDQNAPGQGGWGGLGAHAIVFGKHPAETALITLGTAGGGGTDRLFFSAVNPTIDFLGFRVNDKGAAILDPATVSVTIDGQTFTPVASPKVLDATDFTYTPPRPFFPNVDHTYSIVARDTLGNSVTDTGTFRTPPYAYLTAADRVTANTQEPGFRWSIHQNEAFTENSISRALHQLAGLLGPNLADPDARGDTFIASIPGPTANHPFTFQMEELLNVNEQGGATEGEFGPDSPMPGLPGLGQAAPSDGVAVEIVTYLQLPVGRHTLIVNSDDGFRTIAGNINDIFLGQVAGEYDAPAGRTAADTPYVIRVADAGVYAFKTIYQDSIGNASIEWKSAREDGTHVLLNDLANGGILAYRSVSVPLPTGINMVSPLPNAQGAAANTRIFASILEGTPAVTLSSVQLRLDGTLTGATATRTGNLITIAHQPSTALSSAQHTAVLSYTAGGTSRTQSWTFRTAPAFALSLQKAGGNVDLVWTDPTAVLEESTDLVTWNDVIGATSPHRISGDPRRTVFYRLRR